MQAASNPSIRCQIELFGIARLAAGRTVVPLDLCAHATMRDAIAALGRACPKLVGRVVRANLAGLAEGYVLNLNGLSFVDRLETRVSSGDSILLLSNEAGG